MTHLIRFCILIFSILFLTSPQSFAASADDSTGRDDAQVYHLFKDVDLVTTLKTQSNHNPKYFIKSVYPQLEGDTDKENPSLDYFNSLVSQLIQQEILIFKNNVTQNQKTLKNLPKKASRTSTLYVDYDTSTIKSGQDHLISVRFTMQGYFPGMAHPFHYHRVLNYDIESGEKIELAQFFESNSNYLTVLSNYTSQILNKRLSDKSLITTGTMPTPENFKNWNIKPNGLLITFDEYQVAPYVNGTQTVLIPYAALDTVLANESLISSCVNHKKKCARSNILTGGFIDTAVETLHSPFDPILS